MFICLFSLNIMHNRGVQSIMHVISDNKTLEQTNTKFSTNISCSVPPYSAAPAILYDITVSALSVGTWKEKVPVTRMRHRDTHLFSHRQKLVLSYRVCLAVALVFAAIAMWFLPQNGMPAADGGFL
jgi:hypothetical protein